jgi:hypothetical protein
MSKASVPMPDSVRNDTDHPGHHPDHDAALAKDHAPMSASPRIASAKDLATDSATDSAKNSANDSNRNDVAIAASAAAAQEGQAETQSLEEGRHDRENDSAHPASPGTEAVLAVIARLEDLLREETASLRGASIESLKAMNHRKSQCLLEFTRTTRGLDEGPPHPRLAAGLQRLGAVIAQNQSALSTHFEAVREIAGIIAETMRAHESDGTYADRPAPRGALGQEGMRGHAAATGPGGESR